MTYRHARACLASQVLVWVGLFTLLLVSTRHCSCCGVNQRSDMGWSIASATFRLRACQRGVLLLTNVVNAWIGVSAAAKDSDV